MAKRLSKYILVSMLVFSLLMPTSGIAISAAKGEVAGTVKISDTVSIAVEDVNLMHTKDGNVVSFNLNVTNNGSSDFEFIRYWVRLNSKSGAKHSLKVLPEDRDVNRIAPNTSRKVGFYAKLADDVKLSDLVFTIIRWDFSKANFEAPVADVTVPANYNQSIAAGGNKSISHEGTTLKASVGEFILNKNEKEYFAKLKVLLENTGRNTVDLPEWTYFIETSEGYLYPLEMVEGKNTTNTVTPREVKELEFKTNIPGSILNKDWKLVITRSIPVDDLTLPVSIASFILPKAKEQEVSIENDYTLTTDKGTYTAVMHSVQRLPWEDEDIVTSHVSLQNEGDKSLPIPTLTGYYLLDDNIKVEANVVVTDQVVGIPSKGQLSLQVLGKIPYTYEFTTIDLVLEYDPEEEDSEIKQLKFRNNESMMDILEIKRDEAYEIESIGRKSNYAVLNTRTYEGRTQNIVEFQFYMENLERRQTDMTNFVAHVTSPDGAIYPAEIIRNTSKVAPNGKSLFSVWTTLGTEVDTSNLSVMLGEAIAQNKRADGEEPADAYVNAVSFIPALENKEVQESFKEIDVFPYEFSMGNIHTWLDQQGVRLAFDYELKKDLSYLSADDYKLIISVEEENGQFNFSKEYALNAATAAEEGAPSTLKLGTHRDERIEENDPDLIFYLSSLKMYDLKVYVAFQGEKKLLASKQIQWFVTEE